MKNRATFNESWYRVAELKPALHASVRVHRQYFRGIQWYVLQNPVNNAYFRLNQAAYQFVALLDGRLTVSEAWQSCVANCGESAPTQSEALRLLGNLAHSNLLMGDIPPDVEQLLDQQKDKFRRQVQGQLVNFMFAKFPLYDPDHFLNKWMGLVRFLFNRIAIVCYALLVLVAIFSLITTDESLLSPLGNLLDPDQLVIFFLLFVITKVFHEFGHAFLCKYFGQRQGRQGGEVHSMGIMLLVFTPIPYVDTSSSSALKSKWERLAVGAGGMFVEVIIASIAAIIWANTPAGSALHGICYKLMLLTSITTLIFNANPLMRYDGYYILSDLLEMPNLRMKSFGYLRYLAKRYLYGMDKLESPAENGRFWLISYGICAMLYRLLILVSITLMLMDRYLLLGLVVGLIFANVLVFKPLLQLVSYLSGSRELARSRPRAVAATMAIAGVILFLVGVLPVKHSVMAEGVVEPVRISQVHTRTGGFIESNLQYGLEVSKGDLLVSATNPELEAQFEEARLDLIILQAQRNSAMANAGERSQALAEIDIIDEQIIATNERIARMEEQLDSLQVFASFDGIWLPVPEKQFPGAYISGGESLGELFAKDDLFVRAVVSQDDINEIMEEEVPSVHLKVGNVPRKQFIGTVSNIIPVGKGVLPSAVLVYKGGGTTAVNPLDETGRMAMEKFFEVRIYLEDQDGLHSGQKTVVRIDLPRRTLFSRSWRSIRQLFQRRYSV